MAEILLKIPAQIGSNSINNLQAELEPYANVQESPTVSLDITTVALIVGFTANALQVVDILAGWLKRTPRGNQVEIRLSDGRTFKMESNDTPDDFVKQLKAALKDL
jgi:hypothetical protein